MVLHVTGTMQLDHANATS